MTYKNDKSRIKGMFDGINKSLINRRRCKVQVGMNDHNTSGLTSLSSLNQPLLKPPSVVLFSPSLCSTQETQINPRPAQRANWLMTTVDRHVFLDGTSCVSLVHLWCPCSNLNSVPCKSSVGLGRRCWMERIYECFLIPSSSPVIHTLTWALS